MSARVSVGTAGWSIPKPYASLFPQAAGSHLERYAQTLRCVEVNSSFYRPHRRATWERWAASTPPEFRFAVKAPRTLSHEQRLAECGALLAEFLDSVRGLGENLGPILVQLPPTLAAKPQRDAAFFAELRALHRGPVVLEPRHASWFTPEADSLLREFAVSRAAADPPKGSPKAAEPGGDSTLAYWRLHGSPRIYYSAYEEEWLAHLRERLSCAEGEQWVIFDNTALGYAARDAVRLDVALRTGVSSQDICKR